MGHCHICEQWFFDLFLFQTHADTPYSLKTALVCKNKSMIKKVTEVLLGWGLTEHDASIWLTIVFDLGGREIFLMTQVMFFDCDLKSWC